MDAIRIENFNDGETVSYPLVLLRGSAPKDCDQLEINDVNCEVVGGKFKHLINLNVGDNLVEIKWGSLKIEVRIRYEPRGSNLVLQPLYIICDGHDGRFQGPEGVKKNDEGSALCRIDVCCKLLQSILAEKLHESGYGRKTIKVESCQVFYSKMSSASVKEMQEDELWAALGREILGSEIGKPQAKYLGFLSCTEYHGDRYKVEEMKLHEDLLKITDVYVALGGGGLAIFGTACLYTWPETTDDILSRFKDQRLVDRTRFLDDSAYRGTLGACFSTTLGSTLHELCHTFDLGHTDIGIMSRGFDNLHKVFLQEEDAERSLPRLETVCDEMVSIKLKEAESRSFIRKADFSDDVINRPICFDETCFTKSSACILAYHKWFNDYPDERKYVLSYDASMKLVKSTLGIRVIEVRSGEGGHVMANWCFTGKILRYNFQLDPLDFGSSSSLFVEDNYGNILKANIY
ncbi:PREDICTED: putative zinc metalloproteinase YIL108W [Nicrophorus vespilloides]|uniref:Zinc metalloproteinase YIL108W n=1 Tax=Nicrophorus vespilloides TaxID=110193 RepID=A0ABM1MLC2_NICVS|nr:PREDICTED: putative zinc metalloproteinase YIL108W [Nicrophorus vespilloides]